METLVQSRAITPVKQKINLMFKLNLMKRKKNKQAGAELCQAQAKLG
jgi:hypothetical protein